MQYTAALGGQNGKGREGIDGNITGSTGIDQRIKNGTVNGKGSAIKPIEKHSDSKITKRKIYPGKGRKNNCSPLICRWTSSRAGLIPKANDSASREHLGVMSAKCWFNENAQCSIFVRYNFDT